MKKYCTSCNAVNSETAIFCYKCGAKLIEQEQQMEDTKKQKPAFPWKKLIIVLLILLVITGAGFTTYKIGMKKNSSEAYMQKFIESMSTGQFDTAYTMLPMKSYDNLTVESFQTAYQPLGIVTGEIKKQLSLGSNITFHVSFKNKKEEEVCSYEYTIKEQEKKKLLFFPTWAITACDMIVENIFITAPQNAAVMVDGVAISSEYYQSTVISYNDLSAEPTIYQENWLTYYIPYTWAVPHTVKATEEFFTDYEVNWNPTETTYLELLNLDYKPEEQWRKIYAEYIKINGKNIKSYDIEWLEQDRYGFFDVDGDGCPEMLLPDGENATGENYSIYTIRNGEVQYYVSSQEINLYYGRENGIYVTTDHRIFGSPGSVAEVECFPEFIIENGTVTRTVYCKEYGRYAISSDDFLLSLSDKKLTISKKEMKKKLKERGCSLKNGKFILPDVPMINLDDIMTLTYELADGADLTHIYQDIQTYHLLTAADAKPIQWEDIEGVNEKTKSADDETVVISSVETSSQLGNQSGKNYAGSNLIDGNFKTIWAEGVNGVGYGEEITLHLKSKNWVNGISFYNGYLESKKLYDNNGKVTRIRVDFGNNKIIEKEIPVHEITDFGKKNIKNNCVTHINLEEAVTTDKIIITILDAEEGDKYDDTCISEIEVY